MFGKKRNMASSGASGTGPRHPLIDLETVRETLAYMHDDMTGVTGLAKIRDALAHAMAEIEAHEAARDKQHASTSPPPGMSQPECDRQNTAEVVAFTSFRPRFVAWSRDA